MDPVSQACLGASLAQSFTADKTKLLSAFVVGSLAGMTPDLDVLIRSNNDPLLFLEFHRQFTHSLFFIPFGALICALLFYPFIKNKLSFKQIYLFSILGFSTHGLLDACTSYGTQIYWPFNDDRIAWNTVSIIDPLFTFPLLVLTISSILKRRIIFSQIAFVYAVLFLSVGLVQKHRAENMLNEIALSRGHEAIHILVKPSFANRHVWKLIYEYDDKYYVDAVKLLWDSEHIQGEFVNKLNLNRDFYWLDLTSQQAKDIERFRWFSNDYLAIDSENKDYIIDVRYSFLPNRIEPMWGIVLDDKANKNQHVSYKVKNRADKKTVDQFLDMLF